MIRFGALGDAARMGVGIRYHPGEFISYRDHLAAAARAALLLASEGLSAGDRYLVEAATRPEFLVAILAGWRLRAIPVPVPPAAPFSDPAARAGRLARTGKRIGAVLFLGGVAVPGIRSLPLGSLLDGLGTLASGSEAMDLAGDAMCQLTSGSTGEPKAALITHDALVANLEQIGGAVGVCSGDKVVSWLPLHHDMGLTGCLLFSLYHGLDLHLLSPRRFLRRPADWLRIVEDAGATLTAAPVFGYRFAAERVDPAGLKLDSLKAALCGAEPIDAGVVNSFSRRFACCGLHPGTILPCYGLAEATLAVTISEAGRPLRTRRLGEEGERTGGSSQPVVSSGRPLPGTVVTIADPDGKAVPAGQAGRILLEGPGLMRGYLGEEDLLPPFDTGDLGFLADGELYVTGRVRDIIIIRGENRAPEEFEWAAAGVEGVRAVAALATTTDEGEELMVVAEPRAGVEGLSKRISSAVAEATGVLPAAVEIVPKGTIGFTTSGKVRRMELRKTMTAGGFSSVSGAR